MQKTVMVAIIAAAINGAVAAISLEVAAPDHDGKATTVAVAGIVGAVTGVINLFKRAPVEKKEKK